MANFIRVLFCLIAATTIAIQPSFAGNLDFITYYYLEKNTGDVPAILAKIDSEKMLSKPSARGSITGFLSGLFMENPDKIEGWVNRPFSLDTDVALIFATAFSGHKDLAISIARQKGFESRIEQDILAAPSDLAKLKITSPTDFDTLWGASLATGDGIYPRRILEWLDGNVQSKGLNLNELEQLTSAYGGPEFGQVAKQLSSKHPKEVFIDTIISTTALWSLASNARNHTFVADMIRQWIKENRRGYLADILIRHGNLANR